METESFTSHGVVADTRRGLLDSPRWLSSLYFYDQRGSELFEKICETEEYYPTRTEAGLLERYADDILTATGADCLVAELGSGSSIKTRILLASLLRMQTSPRYMPVDVSADFLAEIATKLEHDFPGLSVNPVAAEYGDGLTIIGNTDAPCRLVLFLGSSLGNFEPDEQVALLAKAHAALAPGDALLLGTDLVKDPAVLEAAYNDKTGYTAAFNKNILHHLNERLNGTTPVDDFNHVALWNPEQKRIEMHLQAAVDTKIQFAGAELSVEVKAGERIHTENSYKFEPADIQARAAASGWSVEKTWLDEKQWFGLSLLRR